MPVSPVPSDSDTTYTFAVSLAVYSIIKKKTAKGKAAAPKEEKTVKVKELQFSIDDTNYLDFLQSILNKHGQDQYMLSAKKQFPFRYIPPKVKTQRASDAMDVDNETDYKEMVKKIRQSNPSTTKILVDMKDVKKLPALGGNAEDDNETTDGDDDKAQVLKTSDIESRLIRWRIKLQARYKNDHDEGYTYVGPMGTIALTPAMILDWCRALDEGQATLTTPPNIPSFDITNKAHFLHPARKAQPPAPTPTPSMDVNSLTSVLLLQMLTNSGLLQSASLPVAQAPPAALVPSAVPPVTPMHKPPQPLSSPPLPSPTQLKRFLLYAENNLKVCNASQYEDGLELRGIGPDVLADMPQQILSEVGIPVGDIIHLKKASVAWWNGPDAKRKRSGTSSSAGTLNHGSLEQPVKKKVAYEKRYHDGGGSRFTAPPMVGGDPASDLDATSDYDLYYMCDTQNQWLPVPRGFVVIEDADEDAENNFFAH